MFSKGGIVFKGFQKPVFYTDVAALEISVLLPLQELYWCRSHFYPRFFMAKCACGELVALMLYTIVLCYCAEEIFIFTFLVFTTVFSLALNDITVNKLGKKTSSEGLLFFSQALAF